MRRSGSFGGSVNTSAAIACMPGQRKTVVLGGGPISQSRVGKSAYTHAWLSASVHGFVANWYLLKQILLHDS